MKLCYPYALSAALPRFIAPMDATRVRELPEGHVWTYEAKLDGSRCLASTRGGEVNLWSRRGCSYNSRFPEVLRVCERLPPETVIDGEVVFVDAAGNVVPKPYPQPCAQGRAEYYVFDLLVLRGRSLLGSRLDARRQQLCEILYKLQYPVIAAQSFTVRPADLIRAAGELRIQALIAKHKGSLYEPGSRSRAWLKYRLPTPSLSERA